MTRVVAFGLALILSGSVACTTEHASNDNSPTLSNPVESPSTATDPPARPAEETFYETTGPIVVENQVDVEAQREGMISEINRDTGVMVHTGDLLARLDDRQLLADRDSAEQKLESIAADVSNWESELKVLQADLARAQKMWDAHIISKELYEHAQYNATADEYELLRERKNYLSQQAAVQALDFELQKTKVTAPFDGVVARRYVRTGQRVGPGDRLFWVTAVAPLRVRFTLPERFVTRIRNGDAISVSSLLPPPANYVAKVIQVSPVVDPASDTIEILAEIAGSAPQLRPGMKANVRVRNMP